MLPRDDSPGQIEIRELQGAAELADVERLEAAIWGGETGDSKELLLAIQHEGGLVAGAIAPGAGLVGFVFAFPTPDPRVQHSHSLGVLDDWRRHGLGARLKWFQRDWSLARGIELVRWTYDPLRAINADLNIRRLGARAGTYWEAYYGDMAGINAGTPSDRILAEWRLKDPAVAVKAAQAAARAYPKDDGAPSAVPANRRNGTDPANGLPLEERLELEVPEVRVNLPEDFSGLLANNLPLALAWRLHVRRLLCHYFQQGYIITDFTRLGGPAYILSRR